MKPTFTKLLTAASFAFLALFSANAHAQTKPTLDSVINKNSTAVKNTANSVVDAKNTLSETKAMFSSFLPAKKPKDTVFVMITNIKYGNTDLTTLKAEIAKKTKNEVPSMLKEGIVVLKVIGRKEASEVYDQLTADTQKKFEPQDMDGNRLMLQYKSN